MTDGTVAQSGNFGYCMSREVLQEGATPQSMINLLNSGEIGSIARFPN